MNPPSPEHCWCESGLPFEQCHGSAEKRLFPGHVSPSLPIPAQIKRPEYALTGRPRTTRPATFVETPSGIEGVRKAGHLAREVLKVLVEMVRPGVTTNMIDQTAHQLIIASGGYPSPLNYCGFPKSICTSVNEVICHGIPDDRPLQNGDIINIDVTVFYEGYHGDCSETVFVGEPDPVSRALVKDTWEALRCGIEVVRPGIAVSEIGRAIENYIRPQKWGIVRAYCGHGVGSVFHTDLQVSHYCDRSARTRLQAGMIFTIEPMINMGTWKHQIWADGWTAVTADLKRSAQFEHTILVTRTGSEILTLLPDEPFECPVR